MKYSTLIENSVKLYNNNYIIDNNNKITKARKNSVSLINQWSLLILRALDKLIIFIFS